MDNFSTPFILTTKEYVADFIAGHFNENICYHNIDHTLEVVEAAEIIGRQCGISEKEMEIVIVASWFHDTGYYLGYENHEIASARIASAFLKKHKKEKLFIDAVSNCILSTKVPQSPNSVLEKIICDADLYHLASENFFEKSKLLWREFSHDGGNMTPEKWLTESKLFVESHEYHTKYGKEKLTPQLQKNLDLLTSKIKSSDF